MCARQLYLSGWCGVPMQILESCIFVGRTVASVICKFKIWLGRCRDVLEVWIGGKTNSDIGCERESPCWQVIF